MTMRSDYQDDMEAKLQEWCERLDALRPTVGHEIMFTFHEQLVAWARTSKAAATKLAELKTTPRDHWGVVRAELAALWHEMERALDDISPRRE